MVHWFLFEPRAQPPKLRPNSVVNTLERRVWNPGPKHDLPSVTQGLRWLCSHKSNAGEPATT